MCSTGRSSDLPEQLSRQDLAHEAVFEQFPTQDPGMIRLFHQVEKLAPSDLGIFIWGESGTGKEALARTIHNSSSRSDGPFIAVEADSRDPESFPGFFFGQDRDWSGSREESAGVLEQADGGTLFLNNIDALSLPMQVRLKRVIQNDEYYRENSTKIRKIDVRLIVSSTHDLTLPEYMDTFSRDLLYHLMVNSIQIPPLRERQVDIPLLADLFLREEVERTGKKIVGFSDEFLEPAAELRLSDERTGAAHDRRAGSGERGVGQDHCRIAFHDDQGEDLPRCHCRGAAFHAEKTGGSGKRTRKEDARVFQGGPGKGRGGAGDIAGRDGKVRLTCR